MMIGVSEGPHFEEELRVRSRFMIDILAKDE